MKSEDQWGNLGILRAEMTRRGLTYDHLAEKRLRSAWSLAAFNAGVEIGQVTIVLLAVPLLAALRRFASPRVARVLLTGAACGVVLVGSLWLWERVLTA